MRRSRAVGAAVAVLASAALATPAAAHRGIGTRFEAPIPFSLLLVGAGLTVALTAAVLAVGEVDFRTRTRGFARVGPGTARALRAGARGLFFAAFVGAVAAGVLGRQAQLENAATLFVWPVWLKGLAVVAMVAGSPWRVLSPWRALYDGLRRLEGGDLALASYPDRLGAWPAFAFFVLGIGLVENLTGVTRSPALTAAVLVTYAAVMLVGGVAFGPDWFEQADALAVLYRLFGRVAPLDVARTDDGGYELALRAPWTGATRPVETPAVVAVAVAAVYTVSFDAFAGTRTYGTLAFALREVPGPGSGTGVLLYLGGLLAFLGGFLAVVALTTRLSGAAGTDAAALAPTVLPIAAAYELAHNAAFVVVSAGLLAEVLAARAGMALALDPLGWLSLPVFWAGQVAFVVAGHLVAVVAAHAVLARITDRVGPAHALLTALMVGYTVLSLWVISRPVVA